MRLPLIPLILVAFLPIAAHAQDRTSVHLFQYGGRSDDAALAFDEFQYVLGEKLPQLAGELLEGDIEETRLSGLARLSLQPVAASNGPGLEPPSQRIKDLAERREYWKTTGALALLTGRIKEQNAGAMTIRSNFFLGRLGKTLGHETLVLELPATAKAYETTNDSHSIAIIAALAMEILYPSADNDIPACANRSEVFYLLNQASLRASAVASEDHDLGERLGEIISTALETAGAACPNR